MKALWGRCYTLCKTIDRQDKKVIEFYHATSAKIRHSRSLAPYNGERDK